MAKSITVCKVFFIALHRSIAGSLSLSLPLSLYVPVQIYVCVCSCFNMFSENVKYRSPDNGANLGRAKEIKIKHTTNKPNNFSSCYCY